MQYNSGRFLRNWLFRLIVFMSAGLVVYSFTCPWWTASFGNGQYIQIFGWGLRHNLVSLNSYVMSDITPQWQTALAWVYLVISIMLMLQSTFTKRKVGTFILGGIGLTYIIYALIAAFVVIANRISVFGIQFQGKTNLMVGESEFLLVHTSLQPGFYLALASGAFIILLAVFHFLLDRNRIKDSV